MLESSYNVAMSSHPIITLLNMLSSLICGGLVKKYANILLVGKCLTLIFPCFTLSYTQNNLMPMCLDLLENDIFPFLAIFFDASLSCHKISDLVWYSCASKNYSYQILYVRYLLFPITFDSFELLGLILCLLDLAIKSLYHRDWPLRCVTSCPCSQHEMNWHSFVFNVFYLRRWSSRSWFSDSWNKVRSLTSSDIQCQVASLLYLDMV